MKTELTTLPSGLRVATCEIPHAETASLGIWADVGGRHEPAKLNGISHFIEHMLFKGTKRRSARRIMEEVEGVGGDLNAYTAEERTCYYAAAAAEFFPAPLRRPERPVSGRKVFAHGHRAGKGSHRGGNPHVPG